MSRADLSDRAHSSLDRNCVRRPVAGRGRPSECDASVVTETGTIEEGESFSYDRGASPWRDGRKQNGNGPEAQTRKSPTPLPPKENRRKEKAKEAF